MNKKQRRKFYAKLKWTGVGRVYYGTLVHKSLAYKGWIAHVSQYGGKYRAVLEDGESEPRVFCKQESKTRVALFAKKEKYIVILGIRFG